MAGQRERKRKVVTKKMLAELESPVTPEERPKKRKRRYDYTRKKDYDGQPYCKTTGASTWCVSARTTITFERCNWVFRINDKYLFPSMRKGDKMKILSNGELRGYAMRREGQVPLPLFHRKGDAQTSPLVTKLKDLTGLFPEIWKDGYFYITIGPYKYYVIEHFTEHDFLYCDVYEKGIDYSIGYLQFSPDFQEVTIHCGVKGRLLVFHVVTGYVVNQLAFQLAAGHMQLETKIFT